MNSTAARTFITVSKLIDGLKERDLLNDASKLRIGFSDFFFNEFENNKTVNIRIVSIKTLNNNSVASKIDLNDLFDIAGGINVWLNVGRQLNKIRFPLTKQLHGISINLTQKSFTNKYGDIISFYKIHYLNVKSGDENIKIMNKLETELHKKTLEWFEAKCCFDSDNESDNDYDIDPDAF